MTTIKLQNIIFPSYDFSPEKRSYIKTDGKVDFRIDKDVVTCQKASKLHFDTYFNCFSIEKWLKYTKIKNVKLCLFTEGKFDVTLRNEYRFKGDNKIVSMQPVEVSSYSKKESHYTMPSNYGKGIFNFTLTCKQDASAFYGGYFYTEIEDSELNDVNIAIDICTFKRETFVYRNMELLKRTIINNPESEMFNKVEVFISDNGHSLSKDKIGCDKINVLPNKNAGGAGGFTRGLMEILKSPNYSQFSHVIMMDDDIVFSYETIYRTYKIFTLLKEDRKDAFIGGAMLNLDAPHIQSENMDLWKPYGCSPIKYRYDTRELKWVLKNEIEDVGNYFGWWYCAMPIGVVKNNNLPLPLFIKRDDIEYGLRNPSSMITVNGLAVLHEAFDNKKSSALDYYYWRNQCIINSIHCPGYGAEDIKKQIWEKVRYYTVRMRYMDAELVMRAVDDFLLGVDWLKSKDPVALHAEISKLTYKAVEPRKLGFPFSHGVFEKSLTEKPLTGKAEKIRKLTLNGLLLNASRTQYVEMDTARNNPPSYKFYKAGRVIHYDERSNTAFMTTRSRKKVLLILKAYRDFAKRVDEKYDIAKTDYRMRYRELTNISFWNEYLGLSNSSKQEVKQSPKLNTSNEKAVVGVKAMAEIKTRIRKAKVKRFTQAFSCCVPMQKNKVVFYVHDRKGKTCNPKYILDYMLKNYKDKFEIVWASKYPSTCGELVKQGIKVVEYASKEHRKEFITAKTIVTNDCIPEGFKKRKGQILINTWHAGMNYKKIGNKVGFLSKYHFKAFKMRNPKPTYVLSGSKYFTDDTSKSFEIDSNKFVSTGLPRNDIFFADTTKVNAKIRAHYGIASDTKLVLYAPTFRNNFKAESYDLQWDELCSTLSNKFGGNWVVLFRKHYFIKSALGLNAKNVIDVSDYDDMNELLAISDVLISDYSSCLWDFCLTKRPAYVYATDIKTYDREYSYPLAKWPYSIATSNKELFGNIANHNQVEFEQKINGHLTDAVSYDKGDASKQVVELIIKKARVKYAR